MSERLHEMSPKTRGTYNKIGRALHGMPCDLAVVLLMTIVTDLIRQSGRPEIWDSIAVGIRATQAGSSMDVSKRMQ